MPYKNIREEELKNKVSEDWFSLFDSTKIIGNIDFAITLKQDKNQTEIFDTQSLLWTEAKKDTADTINSITQLILTIGKARTFDKFLPPAYLGAFDSEKIAFISYSEISDIFYINDFNWNVTPSNYDTKEFNLIKEKVTNTINKNSFVFSFEKDPKHLKEFIKTNFVVGKVDTSKISIDKNNFMVIYNKWLENVKPTIQVKWEVAKKSGIIDGDFYLADLLSRENESLKDSLFVFLKKDKYELDRKIDDMGMFSSRDATFNDNQKAHTQFWNKYNRPPKEEYWGYIVERRDLLVPQDVRERKGSFFTPKIWVEKSQEYIKDVLGEDWQDEYYIWDCACGTGNLLNGLTNKYNIFASTLDKQDVDVIHDRIENGANLLKEHCFQFDFLNDPLDESKLPKPLLDIINHPEKSKKLVVYINPPYAEATTATTVTGTGENKAGVTKGASKYHLDYKSLIKQATNEIFALFMTRVYKEIEGCKLAQFSTLKFINGSNFKAFKNIFKAEFKKGFITPSNTFDNVKGKFPIGFTFWDLSKKENINNVPCDIFDKDGSNIGIKNFYGSLGLSINKWVLNFEEKNKENNLGIICTRGNDFQNQNFIYLVIEIKNDTHDKKINIKRNNIIPIFTYLSVRHCIPATWLNDRDQFLYPIDGWQEDKEFQNDCLAYTLFHGQNRITSKEGTNHWIPFTEQQVNAKTKFDSNFMTDFINGKIKQENDAEKLFNENNFIPTEPLEFSTEAQAVFDTGLELWQYYHQQNDCNVNASFYDIKEHFQGRNAKGRMNVKSNDEHYMILIKSLRDKLSILAEKIQPKVYEYKFLMG